MGRSQAFIEPLRVALQALTAVIGPSFTSEEAAVTIQLSHDRGMRMRRLLRETCPKDASEEMRRQLDALPTAHQGRHIYVLHFGEVRFEWPARAIPQGDGQYRYI